MKYYVKDLKTSEIHEFNRPIEVQKFLEMGYRVHNILFVRKQVVKDRYILSLDLDFTRNKKAPVNELQHLVIEFNGKIEKRYTTLKALSEEFNIALSSIRQAVDTPRLIYGKLRVFTSEDKIVPINKKTESYRKFHIFDALENKHLSTTCTLNQLADKFGCVTRAIHNSIQKGNKIKCRYIVSYKKINPPKPKVKEKVNIKSLDVNDLKPAFSGVRRIGKEIIKQRLNNIK